MSNKNSVSISSGRIRVIFAASNSDPVFLGVRTVINPDPQPQFRDEQKGSTARLTLLTIDQMRR